LRGAWRWACGLAPPDSANCQPLTPYSTTTPSFPRTRESKRCQSTTPHSPKTPSFPRTRESILTCRTPGPAPRPPPQTMDPRLREDDGIERARSNGPALCALFPRHSSVTTTRPTQFPRHSREGGNPSGANPPHRIPRRPRHSRARGNPSGANPPNRIPQRPRHSRARGNPF